MSIVIPALNEEGVVGNTVKGIPLHELKKLGLETEILVVDNASEDNTAKDAEEAGARVVYEPRRGYGSAYLRGLKEAKGDIIVLGDADGTYPFDITHEFIKPLLSGEADFVMGTRLNGHIHDGAMPWLHRHVGNPFLTFIGNLFFKTNISDFHCGMRAFTCEALSKMSLHTTGMEFATEMIVEAGRKKLRIVEVPIEYRQRGGGKAKINSVRDGWRHLRFMFMYSPDFLFLAPGAVIFSLGLLLMSLLLRGPVFIAGIWLDIHPMVLGSLLSLLGLNILLIGFTAKTFAIAEGFIEKDRFVSFIQRHFQLEKGIVSGLILLIIGAILNIQIFYRWYAAGFGGPLPTIRIAIFAATLMVIGIQIIFSAWFMSIMGIERHKR